MPSGQIYKLFANTQVKFRFNVLLRNVSPVYIFADRWQNVYQIDPKRHANIYDFDYETKFCQIDPKRYTNP